MLNNIGIKQPKDRLHATEKCSYEATNHKILRHDVRLLTSKGGRKIRCARLGFFRFRLRGV